MRTFYLLNFAMKLFQLLGFVLILLLSCEAPKPKSLLEKETLEREKKRSSISSDVDDINANWQHRSYTYKDTDSLFTGNTYLAVYSEIYARTENRTYPLTATVSIRNTSLRDSVFVNKSEYYDTHGDLVKTYFDKTIYISPMETVEIIIAEDHEKGGSGGNFVFHWATRDSLVRPVFEAVMISASGQQGISIATQGIDLPD